MDYSKINSENYDFLWTVGIHYLFCSFYKEAGYEQRDFIFYLQGNKSHTMWVSKKEREDLSKIGLELYTTGFNAYKKHIQEAIGENNKKIDEIMAKDLATLSNEALASDFNDTILFCEKIWTDYFFMDYHSTDLVEKILNEKNPNYDLALLQKYADEMAQLKYDQRAVINRIVYPPAIVDKYAEEIKSRLTLKFDVYAFGYKELVELLKGNSVDVPDRTGHIIWGTFSDNKEIIGDEAKKIFDQLEKTDLGITEFKGSIGNKGYAKGRVKKINFSMDTDFAKEIEAMNIGDILVSGSTGPEMILACKKAAAIVTDEGGIISHAALVARELGIPAVIGTKIATKVLNDGDMVEVDANSGIVRILK